MSDKKIKLGKPEVEIKKDTVVVTYDKNTFIENAPDKDAVKEVFDYIGQYTTAVTEDVIAHAPGYFKKHKKAKEVQAKAPFGATNTSTDVFSVRIEKERSSRNPSTGETIVKPRVSTMVKSRHFPGKTFLTKKRDELMEKL